MPAGDGEVGRAQEDRDQQGRARFGLPGPVQPAPPGGLQLGRHHQPFGCAGRGPVGYHPVGGVGDVENLDVGESGS